MPLHRFTHGSHWPGLLLSAIALCVGCERQPPAQHADTVHTVVAQPSSGDNGPSDESTWLPDAGVALLVEGPSPDEAIAVGPHDDNLAEQLASLAANGHVILLSNGGGQSLARLSPTPTRQDADCIMWTLRDVRSEAGAGWSIGFAGTTHVSPIALDSVDVLSPRDSMTLVAETSRLASAVTTPSGPAFQGLRFTAHDIRRFEPVPGVQALAAHMIRRVNQEANPQEEQTLLIAERDSGAVSGSYRLVYAERTSGMEDQVTTPEVIGAAVIGGRPVLIVAQDSESGISYSILERIGSRQWRVRWTSKPTICS